MNEQILSFLRTLIQSGAAMLATKGVIDESGQQTLVAFVMWLIPTVWGLYVRRRNGLIAAAAAALPPGGVILTTSDIAGKLAASANVVSRG